MTYTLSHIFTLFPNSSELNRRDLFELVLECLRISQLSEKEQIELKLNIDHRWNSLIKFGEKNLTFEPTTIKNHQNPFNDYCDKYFVAINDSQKNGGNIKDGVRACMRLAFAACQPGDK